MPAMAKNNHIKTKGDHLVFDAIHFTTSITHIRKPEALEGIGIRE